MVTLSYLIKVHSGVAVIHIYLVDLILVCGAVVCQDGTLGADTEAFAV